MRDELLKYVEAKAACQNSETIFETSLYLVSNFETNFKLFRNFETSFETPKLVSKLPKLVSKLPKLFQKLFFIFFKKKNMESGLIDPIRHFFFKKKEHGIGSY